MQNYITNFWSLVELYWISLLCTKYFVQGCGCTYSAYKPFTKNKERIQKFKEMGDSKHLSN